MRNPESAVESVTACCNVFQFISSPRPLVRPNILVEPAGQAVEGLRFPGFNRRFVTQVKETAAANPNPLRPLHVEGLDRTIGGVGCGNPNETDTCDFEIPGIHFFPKLSIKRGTLESGDVQFMNHLLECFGRKVIANQNGGNSKCALN